MEKPDDHCAADDDWRQHVGGVIRLAKAEELTAQSGEAVLTYTVKKDMAGADYAVINHFTPVKELVIPSEVNGIPVKVFDYGFNNGPSGKDQREMLEMLEISEGVEEIGLQAFSSFTHLKSVLFPSSMKKIGTFAFSSCISLSDIRFAAGSEKLNVGLSAFSGIPLEDVTLPDGTSLASFTYEHGQNPYLHTYAEGWLYTVLSDGSACIYQPSYVNISRSELKQAEVPEMLNGRKVTRIGNVAFWNCIALEKVVLPEGIEYINDRAFAGCSSLREINLPSTLQKIGFAAFAGIAAEEFVVSPEVETATFWYCSTIQEDSTGLFSYGLLNDGSAVIVGINATEKTKKITIPAMVDEIPVSMISLTPKGETTTPKTQYITSITVSEGIQTLAGYAFAYYTNLTQIKLPKSLTEIGDYAFWHTEELKTVQIPDNVDKFGKYIFEDSAVNSVTLPKSMKEIPDEMFSGAYALKSIKIPNGVTHIGTLAFKNCYSLSSVTLPEGLMSIGNGAFAQNENQVRKNEKETNGKKSFSALKQLKLPASLQIIGNDAFFACDALTTVTFAKKSVLQEIGDNAFQLCLRLKEVILPDSVQTIGNSVFEECAVLQKVNLGGGVVAVGEAAFQHDAAMISLIVPDNLMDIGENLLEDHGEKLTVTCGEGSAMENYLKKNYPEVAVKYPKTKKIKRLQQNRAGWGFQPGFLLSACWSIISLLARA